MRQFHLRTDDAPDAMPPAAEREEAGDAQHPGPAEDAGEGVDELAVRGALWGHRVHRPLQVRPGQRVGDEAGDLVAGDPREGLPAVPDGGAEAQPRGHGGDLEEEPLRVQDHGEAQVLAYRGPGDLR